VEAATLVAAHVQLQAFLVARVSTAAAFEQHRLSVAAVHTLPAEVSAK